MIRRTVISFFVLASAATAALWWLSEGVSRDGLLAGYRETIQSSSYRLDAWARNGMLFVTVDRCPACLRTGGPHSSQCAWPRGWVSGWGPYGWAHNWRLGPFRWMVSETALQPPSVLAGPVPIANLVTAWVAHSFWLPLWSLMLPFLIYPVAALITGPIRRRRRRKRGLCVTCAYDLRGLPEPRCPECGTRH
jgi:hypothetical protein